MKTTRKKNIIVIIPEDVKIKIIHHWKTQNNNQISDMVIIFNYPYSAINTLIDNYLRLKN